MNTREPMTDIPDDGGWDSRVTAWERVCATRAFQTLAAEVMQAAKPRSDDRVVDLGAGTGLLALELAARVERVVAVDASRAMLERLEERSACDGIDNLEVSHADLRSLPLDDESATLIVSNYAFHHLDDEGKELALAEARRVLQPGGRLIVCDMMFGLSLGRRDRKVIGTKLWTIARRGPAGFVRIGRNAARVATGTWEKPAPPQVWQAMLAGVSSRTCPYGSSSTKAVSRSRHGPASLGQGSRTSAQEVNAGPPNRCRPASRRLVTWRSRRTAGRNHVHRMRRATPTNTEGAR